MDAAAPPLDHRSLYRLPWSLPDTAISWLEPTSACNLACDGCYHENVPASHRPLAAIRREIARFARLRNADGISLAGGDPLMHPDVVDIVRLVAEQGCKPILNTNGARLPPSAGGRKVDIAGLHFQSVMVIQPVDLLPNGLQDMCDGCPDMTLWNGELVRSCRMEEQALRLLGADGPRES